MKRNTWVENLFRPLVIAAMIGCVAISLVGLVQLFDPTRKGTYLIAACVLAALEASYSYRLIRPRRLRGNDALRFRLAEVMLFFILLKAGSYVGDRWQDVLADVRTWSYQPSNILDPDTTVAFLLALISWAVTTQTIRDMERIGEPPARGPNYVPPRESLANRFFIGGAVLMLIAGLNRIGIAALLNLRRPSVPGLVLNVLAYFILGLVMLGQAHFVRLYRLWQEQKIKIADKLAGRWVRYSLAFLALAALVAFLLPTGYSMGLLEAAMLILSIITFVLTVIVMIISTLIGLLFVALARLLGLRPTRLPQPIAPLRLAPQPSASAGGSPTWFEILRSLLFWAVALGMIIYVIRSYLRDHPEVLQALTSLKLFRALHGFLSGLWRRLLGLTESVRERLPRRFPLRRRRGEPEQGPFRWFRLGALSPRERILYYYLSILRRAGQRGIPRHSAQTPHEYKATLGPRLPEAQQDMNVLTDAFIEARYSLHPTDREQSKQVRTHWQQVKAALRALRKTDRQN